MKTVNLEELTEQVKKLAEDQKDGRAASQQALEHICGSLELVSGLFQESEAIDSELSGKERRRLIGSRVRNNGFIDKAFEIFAEYQNLIPPGLTAEELKKSEARYEVLRMILLTSQRLVRYADNAFLLQSDKCFRDALFLYNSLRVQARAKVPGADVLFASLSNFFHRRKKGGEELTEKEIERDFRKLMHGKADGEIVIENETPQTTGGTHPSGRDSAQLITSLKEPARSADKVIDNVRTDKIAIKATDEAEKIA